MLDRTVMIADTNEQTRRPICARICARDVAGQAETGETQKAWGDCMPQVCRGQRGDWRLSETGETNVVWLITQRPTHPSSTTLLVCNGAERCEGIPQGWGQSRLFRF